MVCAFDFFRNKDLRIKFYFILSFHIKESTINNSFVSNQKLVNFIYIWKIITSYKKKFILYFHFILNHKIFLTSFTNYESFYMYIRSHARQSMLREYAMVNNGGISTLVMRIMMAEEIAQTCYNNVSEIYIIITLNINVIIN